MIKITGRQRLHTTLAAAMAFTMLAVPLAGTGTAYAQENSKPGLAQHASTAEQAKREVAAQVQYDIQAKLDTEKMTITGKQTVTYRNTSSDPLHDVVFRLFADANRSKETQPTMFAGNNEQIAKDNPDKKPEDFLGGIDIISVKDTSTGQTLDYQKENQALTVPLAKTLKEGEAVTLELEFKTKIPFGEQRLSYYEDIVNGAHWFPVMSVYDGKTHIWAKKPYSKTFESDYYDIADYHVSLNVPEELQVAMPGQLTESAAEAGRKTVTAQANNTREFVFFASPKYHKASKTVNGLTVEYYYYNDDNDAKKTDVIHQYIDQAFKAISFFSKKFGPYDYPEFRIVESHVQGYAVEFSRLIQMGLVRPQDDPENNTAFVHEIAHQWFHSIIGNDSEHESFLDEGFADFAMAYFYEAQGNKISGFDGVRMDEYSLEATINSTNDNVGDAPDAVFYKKGRQAIYELYRTVGQAKFDAFMKAYYDRYAYRNATVEGLLQTIEEQFGTEIRQRMDENLNKPNYELKAEFRMTEAEKANFGRTTMTQIYDAILGQHPDLPQQSMLRIMDKTLQGEPLAIVLSDSVSPEAAAQQEIVKDSLLNMLDSWGLKATVLTERQAIKKNMETTLAKSNVIAIGNSSKNAFVQAMKPQLVEKSAQSGFTWKEVMGKRGLYGAYGTVHPYNKNRLVVHYFWTDDHINDKAAEAFLPLAGFSTLFPTQNFYQYNVFNPDGTIYKEKVTENPISQIFQQ
ncbi:M1 family metallopeptidase [Paenibacillus popilliae]|uniref:Aminopeptidase N n=1 Tax=Paenibacillus popilliae ATCC 14706 TaxID=1212764 RepID=M9LI91_PAEPP|nr:aminopeptidase N [Paenibacillus popilliae ATCC 14706]